MGRWSRYNYANRVISLICITIATTGNAIDFGDLTQARTLNKK